MRFSALVSILALLGACRGDPAQGPVEESCTRTCRDKFAKCDENACVRGCRISLDRLVEKESVSLFACLDKSPTCDEYAWARCAARIGPHADGGPPVPAKTPDDD